ncbi:MAG: cytochrome c oxidase assembly protein, partial [Frankia sp.]
GLFLGFLELLLDAIPGILVRLRNDLLAPGYYGVLHRPWGPSPMSDQRFGGAILWFVAEIIDLPFLVLLVSRWIRVDAQEAARVDRELDALAAVRHPHPAVHPAAQPAAQPATSGDHSAPAPVVAGRPGGARLGPGPDAERSEESERTRPWWETNPDYLGSTRAARFRKAAAERDAVRGDPDP